MTMGFAGSKCVRMGAVVNASFSASKAAWHSGLQTKGVSFRVSRFIGVTMSE